MLFATSTRLVIGPPLDFPSSFKKLIWLLYSLQIRPTAVISLVS